MSFKERLSNAGLSRAQFARIAKLSPRTVYRWEDGPDWAYALLDLYVEVAELRQRTYVLDRLSQTLIDSDARRL